MRHRSLTQTPITTLTRLWVLTMKFDVLCPESRTSFEGFFASPNLRFEYLADSNVGNQSIGRCVSYFLSFAAVAAADALGF